MKKLAITLTVMLSCLGTLLAQSSGHTVTGKVFDRETQEILPGAWFLSKKN